MKRAARRRQRNSPRRAHHRRQRQMTKPDPRVEAVVRRLHGDLRRLTRAALARYGAVTTRGAPGDLHVVDRECIEAAVRAGLELAAETVEQFGNDYSWKHHRLASAIRALAKGGADE